MNPNFGSNFSLSAVYLQLPPQDIQRIMLCVCRFRVALGSLQRLMLLIYVISSECQLGQASSDANDAHAASDNPMTEW